jgi:hypothetical protein
MPTAKQSAASRANSLKSTGPRTTAGKANSRFNALKHGIDAKQQTTLTESEEDLALLAAEYHELHSPADANERFLVDTMINTEWRLRRLRRVEADLWRSAHNLFMEQNPEIRSADCGDAFIGSGPAFERLQRIVNSCERHFRNARKELQESQAARADALPASQPEETITTSESPASFRTKPEAAENPAPEETSAAPQSSEFVPPTAAEIAKGLRPE